MPYDFSALKQRLSEEETWLQREYGAIRAGRVTPALLDGVFVELYGERMPLSHAASISVEDARTLRVSPWDHGNIKPMEKAISVSGLGVSVRADEKGLWVSFPELTLERRTQLMKVIREKLEKSRTALRGERDIVWSDIQEKARANAISEDDKFKYKAEMQKLIDKANQTLEDMASRKEKELSS